MALGQEGALLVSWSGQGNGACRPEQGGPQPIPRKSSKEHIWVAHGSPAWKPLDRGNIDVSDPRAQSGYDDLNQERTEGKHQNGAQNKPKETKQKPQTVAS